VPQAEIPLAWDRATWDLPWEVACQTRGARMHLPGRAVANVCSAPVQTWQLPSADLSPTALAVTRYMLVAYCVQSWLRSRSGKYSQNTTGEIGGFPTNDAGSAHIAAAHIHWKRGAVRFSVPNGDPDLLSVALIWTFWTKGTPRNASDRNFCWS